MRRSILRQLYDEALAGLPVLGTPHAAVRSARAESEGAAADVLVRRYALLGGTTGFLCGLPGYLTMPVTIPSNLAGIALLQLHLTAALAVLAGREPRDEAVRARCIACVLGTDCDDASPASGEDEREGLMQRLAEKLGERGLRFASEQVVRLVSNGTRSLPLLGGAVGGVSDARSTWAVGQRARRAFLHQPMS